MSDNEKDRNWSVRYVSDDLQGEVAERAKARKMRVGEWLSEAIRLKIEVDDNPPKVTGTAVVPYEPPPAPEDIAKAIELVRGMREAGIEPPAKLAHRIVQLVSGQTTHLRQRQLHSAKGAAGRSSA